MQKYKSYGLLPNIVGIKYGKLFNVKNINLSQRRSARGVLLSSAYSASPRDIWIELEGFPFATGTGMVTRTLPRHSKIFAYTKHL